MHMLNRTETEEIVCPEDDQLVADELRDTLSSNENFSMDEKNVKRNRDRFASKKSYSVEVI